MHYREIFLKICRGAGETVVSVLVKSTFQRRLRWENGSRQRQELDAAECRARRAYRGHVPVKEQEHDEDRQRQQNKAPSVP